MSSYNQNTFRLTNEQLLLINILNTMYNNNQRQIDSITTTLDNLIYNNNQIRNLLVQILNTTPQNRNHNREHNNSRRNTTRSSENNYFNPSTFGRIMIDNQPYIIDSIREYTIPTTNLNNRNQRIFNDELTQLFQSFFQPIEVYPTQSQIETATRRVRYCDIARPTNTSCPISMDEFNDNETVTVIRQCGHIFHTDPLMNWFRSNCRCPVCRYDIRDYNSNASTEFFNNQQSVSDSSNNVSERNNNNNNNNIQPDNPQYSNVNGLFNINGLIDPSGNFTNSSNDAITSFLLNALSRTRNSR